MNPRAQKRLPHRRIGCWYVTFSGGFVEVTDEFLGGVGKSCLTGKAIEF